MVSPRPKNNNNFTVRIPNIPEPTSLVPSQDFSPGGQAYRQDLAKSEDYRETKREIERYVNRLQGSIKPRNFFQGKTQEEALTQNTIDYYTKLSRDLTEREMTRQKRTDLTKFPEMQEWVNQANASGYEMTADDIQNLVDFSLLNEAADMIITGLRPDVQDPNVADNVILTLAKTDPIAASFLPSVVQAKLEEQGESGLASNPVIQWMSNNKVLRDLAGAAGTMLSGMMYLPMQAWEWSMEGAEAANYRKYRSPLGETPLSWVPLIQGFFSSGDRAATRGLNEKYIQALRDARDPNGNPVYDPIAIDVVTDIVNLQIEGDPEPLATLFNGKYQGNMQAYKVLTDLAYNRSASNVQELYRQVQSANMASTGESFLGAGAPDPNYDPSRGSKLRATSADVIGFTAGFVLDPTNALFGVGRAFQAARWSLTKLAPGVGNADKALKAMRLGPEGMRFAPQFNPAYRFAKSFTDDLNTYDNLLGQASAARKAGDTKKATTLRTNAAELRARMAVEYDEMPEQLIDDFYKKMPRNKDGKFDVQTYAAWIDDSNKAYMTLVGEVYPQFRALGAADAAKRGVLTQILATDSGPGAKKIAENILKTIDQEVSPEIAGQVKPLLQRVIAAKSDKAARDTAERIIAELGEEYSTTVAPLMKQIVEENDRLFYSQIGRTTERNTPLIPRLSAVTAVTNDAINGIKISQSSSKVIDRMIAKYLPRLENPAEFAEDFSASAALIGKEIRSYKTGGELAPLSGTADSISRMLSSLPSVAVLSTTDASGTKSFYQLARAFMPKRFARLVADEWRAGTSGSRRKMLNALIRAGAATRGVDLTVEQADDLALRFAPSVGDLGTGTKTGERYGVTAVGGVLPTERAAMVSGSLDESRLLDDWIDQKIDIETFGRIDGRKTAESIKSDPDNEVVKFWRAEAAEVASNPNGPTANSVKIVDQNFEKTFTVTKDEYVESLNYIYPNPIYRESILENAEKIFDESGRLKSVFGLNDRLLQDKTKTFSGSTIRGFDAMSHNIQGQMHEIFILRGLRSAYDQLSPSLPNTSFDDFVKKVKQNSISADEVATTAEGAIARMDKDFVRSVNEIIFREIYGLGPNDTIRLYRFKTGLKVTGETVESRGYHTVDPDLARTFNIAKGDRSLIATDVAVKDLPHIYGTSGYYDELAVFIPESAGLTAKVLSESISNIGARRNLAYKFTPTKIARTDVPKGSEAARIAEELRKKDIIEWFPDEQVIRLNPRFMERIEVLENIDDLVRLEELAGVPLLNLRGVPYSITGTKVPTRSTNEIDTAVETSLSADRNGIEHALHLDDAAGSVRIPTIKDFENLRKEQGLLMQGYHQIGRPLQGATDALSYLTLAGPRFSLRNAVEEDGLFIAGGGGVFNLAKGRVADQWLRRANPRLIPKVNAKGEVELVRKTSLGMVANKMEWLALRAKERGMPEWFSEFIYSTVSKSEIEQALIAKQAGHMEPLQELLVRTQVAHAIGKKNYSILSDDDKKILSYFADSPYGMALYDQVAGHGQYLNSADFPRFMFDQNSITEAVPGITYGKVRAPKPVKIKGYGNIKPIQTDDVTGQRVLGVSAWWRQLEKTLVGDGDIGEAAVRLLDNPQKAKAEVARIIREDKTFGYKDKLSRISDDMSIDEFANSYVENVFQHFTRADGTLNVDLQKRFLTIDPETETLKATFWKPSTVGDGTETYTLRMSDLDDIPMEDRPAYVFGPIVDETPWIPVVENEAAFWTAGRGYSWMGRQNARISKGPIFHANMMNAWKETAIPRARLAEDLARAAGRSKPDASDVEFAERLYAKNAMDQAFSLTVSFVDNPANRSNMAWKARNVSRYYRATEDFWRRMKRVAANKPETFWKVALTYHLLTDTGFVYKDEEGVAYFGYPGNEQLQRAIAAAGMFFFEDAEMYKYLNTNPFFIGGKLLSATPSTDPLQQFPSLFGPVAVGMVGIYNAFPALYKLKGLQKLTLGEYEQVTGDAGRDMLTAATPPLVSRVLGLMDTDQVDSTVAQGAMDTLAIMAATGALNEVTINGKKVSAGEITSASQFKQSDEYVAANQIAVAATITRLYYQVFGAAAPQMMDNNVSKEARELGITGMKPLFRSFVDQYSDSPDPYATAYAMFVGAQLDMMKAGNPVSLESFLPFTQSSFESPTDSPDAARAALASPRIGTDEWMKWYESDDTKELIDEGFYASALFLAPRNGEFDFASWMVGTQDLGLKRRAPQDQLILDLLAMQGEYVDSQIRNSYNERIAAIDSTTQEGRDEIKALQEQRDNDRKWVRTQNKPWDAVAGQRFEQYTDSNYRAAFGEMGQMLDFIENRDGELTGTPLQIRNAMNIFVYYNQQIDGLQGPGPQRNAKKLDLQAEMEAELNRISEADPNAEVFIENVIKNASYQPQFSQFGDR